MRAGALAAAVLVGSCAAPERGRISTEDLVSDGFEPRGQIIYSGPTRRTSTVFDDGRVIGPGVSLSRNPDGTWSGFLQGRAVQLEISRGAIDGASLSLRIEKREDGGVEIRGHWSVGRSIESIYVRVTPEELFARGAPRTASLFLRARGEGRYGGTFFGDYEVELSGDAAFLPPPEPQFALALLGALAG